MLVGSYNVGILKLPTFVEDLFGLTDDSVDDGMPGDEGKLYEAIKDALSDDNTSAVVDYDVTKESLLQAITAAETPNEYTAVYTVTHKIGKNEKIETVRIWKQGDRYVIRKSDEDNVLTSEIYNNGTSVSVTTYVGKDKSVYVYPASDDFTIESDAGIPSMAEFLTSESIADLKITLNRAIDYHLYQAEYSYTDSDQKELTYLILEYNMILHSETVVAGEKVYTCSLDSIETKITGIEFPD